LEQPVDTKGRASDMSTVYLDNGATTKVDARVAEAALHAMVSAYGNPSSAHRLGAEAARLVARAREQVARAIGASPSEIVFTSGGTEANALGLTGGGTRLKHVVTTAFEHPSVADTLKVLTQAPVELVKLTPSPSGLLTPERFAQAVTPETTLATILWVQNEIGTVQPVAEIARAIKDRAPRCHVHVDGVQALGKITVDVSDAPFDSLSLSAHKIHGPKGAGALWLKRTSKARPLVHGGGQERGLRPGTEGVPGIVALGLAVELAVAALPEAGPRMRAQRERLWQRIGELQHTRLGNGGVVRHGDAEHTAPHILSIGFTGVPAEPLLHALEAEDVLVSAGSACHAKDKKPSATLRAIGVPDDRGTIRLSLSRFTTDDEIERAAVAVAKCVGQLSP
jgi:cysteine desulfurase